MRPPAAALAALLAVAPALASCHTVGRGLGIEKGAELSYAQVQTIQNGLTARQIRDAFGEPAGLVRGPDGKVVRMHYPALDARSNRARLTLEFDGREMLVRKTFSGAEPPP
jgi:hypothetical protein